MASAVFSLALGAGGQLLTSLFKPKQKDTYSFGPRVSDLNVPTVSPGNQINRVWGHMKLSTQTIWSSHLIETMHISDQTAPGGKGGGKHQAKSYKISYTYSVNTAFAVCRGPVAQVRRIWAQGKMLWTNPVITSAEIQAEFDAAYVAEATRLLDLGVPLEDACVSGWVFAYNAFMDPVTLTAWSQVGAINYIMTHRIPGYGWPNIAVVAMELQQLFDPVSLDKKFIPDKIRYDSIVVYQGDETQEPDPTLQAALGAANVPGYRGLCYIVLNNLQLADFGNTVPQFTVEVIKDGIVTYQTVAVKDQPKTVAGIVSDPVTGKIISYDPTIIPTWVTDLSGADTKTQKVVKVEAIDPSLQTIISDVISESGLDPDYFSTSIDLDPGYVVKGYCITQPTTARQILSDLQKLFPFDGCATGSHVKFRLHNTRPTMILRREDFGAHQDGDTPPPSVEQTRLNELDLPRRINLKYQEPDRNFSMNTVWAERYATLTRTTEDVDVTVALSRAVAKTLVEQMLVMRMFKRDTFKIKLPRKYILIEPGDVVLIPDKEYEREWSAMRCMECAIGANGILEYTFCDANYVEDSSALVATAGIDIDVTPPVLPINSRTYAYMLDCPILNDLVPDGPQFFTVVTGVTPGWRSGGLLVNLANPGDIDAYGQTTKTPTSGSSWFTIAVGEKTVPHGHALTTLNNDAIPGTWDNASEVIVRLMEPSWVLSNADPMDMLTQALNTCWIEGEICAYSEVEDLGNGVWKLKKWMRGLRGTEYAMSTHQNADRFVRLDTGAIQRVEETAAALNKENEFIALSAGETVASEPTFKFTNTGNALRPYQVHMKRENWDDVGNLTLQWQPRNRLNGGWASGGDIALDQAVEAYELDVYVETLTTVGMVTTSHVSIVRTEALGAVREWVYSAADQSADLGLHGAHLWINLYQVGAIIGRGFPRTINVV